MFADYLKLAVRNITSRRLRSWLTLLGIIIGISAVVSLISLGQGLQQSINDQFSKLGSNRILIAPGGQFLGPGTSELVRAILDDDDLAVIQRARGVQEAHGVLAKGGQLEFGDQTSFKTIFAFDTDPQSIQFVEELGLFDIGDGREFKSGDKFKAILGYNLAHDEFIDPIEVGRKVKLEGHDFTIVGIQKLIGTGVHDQIIRIPLDTLREIANEKRKYSFIYAVSQNGYDPATVVQSIRQDLRQHRGVKEDEEDFNVQTAQQTIEQLNSILLAVQIVIVGIATISLLVGSIGIMNTMYTAVLERTREIGIMKSIGARNASILLLFLLEAGILGLLGGIGGIIIGLSVAKLGEYFAIQFGATFFVASTTPTLIIGSLIFAILVGCASGIFPAQQAAQLRPVDALRSTK